MDSNQRMTGSKPVALPLGYTPMDLFTKDIKYPKERYKIYL